MKKALGIACVLNMYTFNQILRLLAKEAYELYVPWCSRIDAPYMRLPHNSRIGHITALELGVIAEQSIWEMVLSMYPIGKSDDTIETYNDYKKSECVCYIIYYDCGIFEAYIKDLDLMEKLYETLSASSATSLSFITDENNSRTRMYP